MLRILLIFLFVLTFGQSLKAQTFSSSPQKLEVFVSEKVTFRLQGTGPFKFYNGDSTYGRVTGQNGLYTYEAPGRPLTARIAVRNASNALINIPIIVKPIQPIKVSTISLAVSPGTKTLFTISLGKPPYEVTANKGSVSLEGSEYYYIAPAQGFNDGLITIKDSVGQTKLIAVSVVQGFTLPYSRVRVPLSGQLQIPATGGRLPYSFSLTGSGSLFNDIYRAPSVLSSSAPVITVRDSSGQSRSLTIELFTSCLNPQAQAGESITGYPRTSATYPVLCGVRQTSQCLSNGTWGGMVPLYPNCTQYCVHPETKGNAINGSVYTYYTRSQGTLDQCNEAKRTTTCSSSGLFSPTPDTTRYASCRTVDAPQISSFLSSKNSSSPGEGIDLTWTVSGSTSLLLQPGNINVTGKTSQRVSPTQTTTYSLTASSTSGSVSKTLTVTIGGKILAGNYIAEAYAPGCVPNEISDYMETEASINSGRRVEPRNCALVEIATPVFSWVYPQDIDSTQPMTLTVRRTSDGQSVTRQTKVPRLIFSQALPSGMYEWHVQYTNKNKMLSQSEKRRFVVSSTARLSLPTGATITSLASQKGRPRALPVGESFSSLVSRINGSDLKTSYAAFLKKAQTLLGTPLTPEPQNKTQSDFSSITAYNDWLLTLRNISRTEVDAIETLGYAFYFTNNSSYADSAIQRLLSLANWNPNGPTSEATQDQANREIYLILSLGLDLFQTKLTSSQRTTIVTALKNRLNQVTAKFDGINRYPYDSHLLTGALYATEALLYAVGTPEFPEARDLLGVSWEAMLTTVGSWGGADGGFGNGTAYGWYALTTYARTLSTLRLMLNLNLSDWNVFGRFGLNQIALTPPALSLTGQFGDDVETKSHYFDYSRDAFRMYARALGKGEYEWYWRAHPGNLTTTFALQPLVYLTEGLPVPAPSSSTLSNSILFEDAGFVALHSKTTDSLRSSVFFRSSKLGSFNHSHADNNAFTFVSKGKELLITGGYYPQYNTPHHALVGRATRYKNALTFDGGIGQSEPTLNPTAPGAPIFSMVPHGKLVNFSDDGSWALVTGDATKAYRGNLLTNAVRSVAYNRALGVVLVYDWATSSSNRRWELNFQSFFQPASMSSQSIKLTNDTSNACLTVHGPAGAFSFTQGFPVAPEKTRPTQYQSRYSVSTSSTKLVSVTVIKESCNSTPVTVDFSATESTTVSVNGKSLRFNGRIVELFP